MTDETIVDEVENLPAPPPPADDLGLEQAKEDLDKLTPEGYLELVTYLKALETENDRLQTPEKLPEPTTKPPTFTEAPGSANIMLFGDGGRNMQLTGRANRPYDAFRMLAEDVLKIKKEFKSWSDTPPALPAGRTANLAQTPIPEPISPTPVPQDPLEPVYIPVPDGPIPTPAANAAPTVDAKIQSSIEMFEVTSLTHVISENGNHSLKVKGGKYRKWGFTCWPEQATAEVADFESWPVGQEFAPPTSMKFAWLDPAARRFVAFADNIGG